MPCSLEYDQYGFQVYYNEEQLDDVLLAKANKLQRQSDEITSRIKVSNIVIELNLV